MTVSADGTGHRNINYNAHHAHYLAEDYESGNEEKKQVTCNLGINASLDGTSKQSVEDWMIIFQNMAATFNRSPFGKRHGGVLRVVSILIKLVGMLTDHCAKEKKDAVALEKKKLEAVFQSLGEDEFLEYSKEELLEHFLLANNEMIAKIGGQDKME